MPITPLADKLIASLFYIEIDDPLCAQVFLSVVLKCRLPPGPDLVQLLKAAREKNAQIQHGKHHLVLCSDDNLRSVIKGNPFGRTFQIPIQAQSTNLDVTISGISVSNCPYPVGSLIAESPGQQKFKAGDYRTNVIEMIDFLKLDLEQYLYTK